MAPRPADLLLEYEPRSRLKLSGTPPLCVALFSSPYWKPNDSEPLTPCARVTFLE